MVDSGKVQSEQSRTSDVTMLDGSSYRRLIERDDHPLLPKEQKKEQDKLRASLSDRRRETQVQRDKRVAEYDNRPGRIRSMLSEIPEPLDFRLCQEDPADYRPVFAIEAAPRPANL